MTDSGYYYYTASFTEKERESLKDFFGRDLFGDSYSTNVKELTDEQIDQISARIMPKARSSLRVTDLLPSLRKYKALTDTEYSHLCSGSLEQQEQAVRLMEYLMYKGSYGLACLYLSLLISSESKGGLPAHYQLARDLRDIVQEYGMSDDDNTSLLERPIKKKESHVIPLRAAVKKLQGITISPLAAQTLATHFHLPPDQTVSTDLCDVCCQWLNSRSVCDMTELVEVMVVTEGVGRHTSRLCGPTAVPPHDLRNFLLTIAEQWVEIAKYLGFSSDEILTITDSYPHSIGKQVDLFLEKWKMPDSGQRTLPLMHKLKALAGIVEPKRERADSLPSSLRHRLDNSGVPPRRLDTCPYTPTVTPHNSSSTSYTYTNSQTVNQFGDEGSYDDQDMYYCPVHQTYHPRGTRTVHLRIVHTQLPDDRGRRTDQSHSYYKTDGPYMANQDPFIEELSGDMDDQPHPKPQRRIMGNEVTVPDSSFTSLPPLSSRLPPESPKSTPPSSSERKRVNSRTEPHALLGNEVIMGHSPSVDSSRSRGGSKEGVQGSFTPPSGLSSSDGKRRVTSKTEPHALLGNEVIVERSPSVDSSVGRDRGRGNAQKTSTLLGNEVTPPGIKPLGNEVTVGSGFSQGGGKKGRGQAGESRGSLELLGNEVTMPGVRASRKQGKETSQPPVMSVGGLGNEVPLPRTSQGNPSTGFNTVDNGLTLQQSLPVGVGGVGRGRGLLRNEVETDSGYTTTASAVSDTASPRSVGSSSSAGRKPLRSDSSSDSSSNRFTVEPARLGTVPPVPAVSSPSIDRQPSSDNDLSSGEDEEPMSPSTGPSNQQQHKLPLSVTMNSSHPLSGRVQPSSQPSPVPYSPSVAQTPPPSLVSTGEPGQPISTQSVTGTSGTGEPDGGGQREESVGVVDDGENNLDEMDEDEGASKPTKAVPPNQFNIPLQSLPPLESFQPESAEGREGGVKLGEDNDLSAPTPETPQGSVNSAPVFMQGLYTLPPATGSAAVMDEPTLSLSSFSTSNDVAPTSDMTQQHPLNPAKFETVKEYCGEDVLQAIQDSNGMDMLTALVDSGADINLPAPDGSYPIHTAVASGRHETVLFLLNKGASIQEQRSDGKTPLHMACLKRDFEMVQILVEKGADMTVQDKEGYTCLHFKETLETLTIVKYLAHNGAPIDTPSHVSYLTPLVVCCSIGNEMFETAEFLISKGASVDGCPQAGMKPLIITCAEGSEIFVDLLLENNANVNILDHDSNSPLLKACQGGFVSMAKKLCERRSDTSIGADVNHANREGLTPIMAAVLCGRIDVVRTLITYGATVNCYKFHDMRVGGSDVKLEVSPLAVAAAHGNMELVELLIESGANVNASTTAMAPIAIAAMCGQPAVIKHFLKLNDLDVSLHAIAQPFIEAVKANQIPCAELLAETCGGLDQLYSDAVQNSLQELADTVMQLQQMQQQHPTTNGGSSVPSLSSSTAAVATHTTFTNITQEDREGDIDENNFDDEGPESLTVQENSVNRVTPPVAVAEVFSTPPRPVMTSLPHGPAKLHVPLENGTCEAENNLNVEDISTQNDFNGVEGVGHAAVALNNLDTEAENNLNVDEGVVAEPQNNLEALGVVGVVEGSSAAVQNNLDTVAQNNLGVVEGVGSSAEVQNNLDSAAQNNLGVGSSAEVQNNLDTEAQNDLGTVEGSSAGVQNNLDTEPQNDLGVVQGAGISVEMQNNLDTEAQSNLDGVEGVTTSSAEALNNLDMEVQPPNLPPLEAENDLDVVATASSNDEALNNLDVGVDDTSDPGEHRTDDLAEAQNNLDIEGQNNLDAADNPVAGQDVASGFGYGVEAENDLDEADSTSQQAEVYPQSSQLPHATDSSSVTATFPASNAVETPPVTPNFPSNTSTLASVATPVFKATVPRASDLHSSSPPRHDLTEDNQFEEAEGDEEQNNFSDDEPSNSATDLQSAPHASTATSHVLPSSDTQQHRQNWTTNTHVENNFAMPPAPTSAPVGRGFSDSASHSGGPLRASVDTTSYTTLSSGAGGGENLFAPRPKSPPTRVPSPHHPSPHNMLSMDTSTGELQQGGRGMEVLHDFAQMCMMAAIRTRGQEWLINRATKTGYEHLTQFFIQYFHEGVALSICGKLVSEFIGGNPSPLNFLLAGRFIDQASFEDVARDLGQPNFMNELTEALHQFPGSDGLPYTGSEMAAALFSQTFSIGHRYPDPSSLWSSSSPPPTPTPTPTTSSSLSYFPGQGHRLGRDEYSNLSEPAFNSAGSVTASSSQLDGSFPNTFSEPAAPATTSLTENFPLPNSATDVSNTATTYSNTRPLSSMSSQMGSSLAAQPNFPATDGALAVSSSSPSTVTVAGRQTELLSSAATETAVTDDGTVTGTLVGLHKAVATPSVHTLTKDNHFDEVEGELNDLTTEDEDSGGYWPKRPQTDGDQGQLLGNEIEVKPVSRSRLSSEVTTSVSHTPANSFVPVSTEISSPPDQAPYSTTQTNAVPSSVLTPSPPLSNSPPRQTDLLPAHGGETHSSVARPIAQSPTASAHTSRVPADGVQSGTVDTSCLCLTPSPDPPETPSLEQPLVKGQSGNGINDTSPQSGSVSQNPRSSSPPITPCQDNNSISVTPPTSQSKQIPRPSSASSTSSRGSHKAVTKHSTSHVNKGKNGPSTKTCGAAKTKTVKLPNAHSKQPGSLTKPPTTASPSISRKKPQAVTSTRPTPSTKPTARPGLKGTTFPSKTQPSKLAKTSRLPSHPAGAKQAGLHARTGAKKPASKPSLTASNELRTKPSRTTTAGTTAPATALSRGMGKQKDGKNGLAELSSSSLPGGEVVEKAHESVPFKTLEPASVAEVSPYNADRNTFVDGISVDDCISFPDVVIQNPDTSTMFQVLAHRIRRWKIFGRYLGLSDDELDEIEQSNHFTTERSFKMLVHWGRKYKGKYSELEAGIHNIMREDLIEDIRQYLPLSVAQQCSEEENEHRLVFTAFKVEGGSPDIQTLTKSVTDFVRRKSTRTDMIDLRFSHEKLCSPIQIYIPFSTHDCDLTVLQELCFAAWKRNVNVVDLTFEIQQF